MIKILPTVSNARHAVADDRSHAQEVRQGTRFWNPLSLNLDREFEEKCRVSCEVRCKQDTIEPLSRKLVVHTRPRSVI